MSLKPDDRTPAARLMSGAGHTTYEELNQRLYKARRQLRDMRARYQCLEVELHEAQREIAAYRRVVRSRTYAVVRALVQALRAPSTLRRLPTELRSAASSERAQRHSGNT